MTKDQWIAVVGVSTTLIVGIITGIITWIVAKRTQSRKQVSYTLRMVSLMPKQFTDPNVNLEIKYKGQLLVEPVLLSVDITNTGNVPIENPPIEVEAVGATYVIPGYFEGSPAGYEDLWQIERTDAESCGIRLAHINPGQTARVRLLMDELPAKPPIFKCPMAGLDVREQSKIEVGSFTQALLVIIAPSVAQLVKSINFR
jgi:hypothetical protein